MALLEEVCHWGGVGFEASKAGDRNKNQTSKLGQQRQKLDPKSGVGTEGTATKTCTEVERM